MKTVMVFGTFDILHRGHIALFEQARALGDKLIAVVARDKTVSVVKNIELLHLEDERREILSHIDLVDQAVLGNEENVYAVIDAHKPDIIALGYDQTHFVEGLHEYIKQNGLPIQIERLESYKPDEYKSTNFRKILSSTH